MWMQAALILGSYLFGSLPVMYAIGRLRGADLSREPDLHMALWRRVGRLEGTVGILGDFAKGVLPVLVGRSLGFDLWAVAGAGVAAVAGQMWPLFRRFNGEKGNSTGLAMAATLSLYPLLVALIPVVAGAAVRTVPRLMDRTQLLNERLKFGGPPSLALPLGMFFGFAVLPLSAWWLVHSAEISFAFLLLFILLMIRRLTAGIGEDWGKATDKREILLNRLLFDRSYL